MSYIVSANLDSTTKEKATQFCQEGLEAYQHWDIEHAIALFQEAISLNRAEPDYFLYLAQAYMRLGDYEATRRALGEFIHLETDETLINRYEAMFGSVMDQVEKNLTKTMVAHQVPLKEIGAAILMWFEFRLTMGRKTINVSGIKPKAWAAALDYTIRKVNFREIDITELAEWYEISPEAVKQYHQVLVEILDVMPCDYRYFRGQENPLDKLVEAATMLEALEARFYEM